MPRGRRSSSAKKDTKPHYKKIEHKPWFGWSHRTNIKYDNEYELHLVYTFERDKYRCDIEVYGHQCEIVIGENSPFIKHLYRCIGAVQKYSLYSTDEMKEDVQYIVYVIIFQEAMFDKCTKVIYLKFPNTMTSCDNRNSRYMLFNITNVKNKSESV